MRRATRTAGVTLGATLMCAALGAQGTDAPKGAASPLCSACLEVCERPLSYEDSVLDDSTDSYMLAAARGVSKAAAIDMAARLKSIYGEYKAGYFGRAYEANAAAIESLVTKPAEGQASSAEIRALKTVRAALYADTIVGLEAAAAGSPSQKFLTAHAARKAVLDSTISGMAARQQMRAAERLAVCEVLAAYKDN
jgi:hypothetical protein